MGDLEIGATDETLASDSTLAAPQAARRRAEVLGRGVTLGRYVLLRHLGSGGMGAVYEAFDPELERKVAVKVIHPLDDERGSSDDRTARFHREARTLAKLVHPNVVAVYDVGSLEAGIFVAMELIDGASLRKWLELEPRSLREILRVLVAAGRGLAAAHASGIVHRDFKPDNVMVSTHDGVKVLDFGLATVDRPLGRDPGDDARPVRSALTTQPTDLTATGAIMGTPAYMAPEQHRGTSVDPRADQFAFCVTLYEAITGQRPFVADTLPALVTRVIEGDLSPLPSGTRLPRWLATPILRGLSTDPAQRWPSMDDLLAQLQRRPLRRRVQLGFVALAVASLGTVVGGQWLSEVRRLAACRDNDHELAGVWDEAQRRHVAQLHLPYADERATARLETLDRRLTEYRDAWLSAFDRSCVAGVESTSPRAHCLDDARARFAAVSAVLEQAESEKIIASLAMLGSRLPDPATCEADDVARRFPIPDERAEREPVAEIRVDLARASALSDADHTVDALAASEDALARARIMGYRPLIAEAAMLHARHLADSGHIDDAKALTWEALAVAERAQHRQIVARAWAFLVYLVGVELRRPAEALELVAIARAAAELWGAEHDTLSLESNIGAVYYVSHDWDKAAEHFERVVAGMESLHGSDAPSLVDYLNNLAAAEAGRKRSDRAARHFERALAISEETLGAQHSRVANILNNLSALAAAQGDAPSAIELSQRALQIRERVYGPDHQETGNALRTLATAYYRAERYEEAAEVGRRSLDAFRRVFAQDHPSVAMAQINLALSLGHLGRHDEAVALALACVASRRTRTAEPLKLASALTHLARILMWSGACEQASAHALEALELARSNGPDEALMADAQEVIAACDGSQR